ncbi:uncharacterized protein LOC111616308 [Centruroides sculpturatus]|uniref:uncharacterized protein LOC111616308 n=1 Tax=Centruroides sculpturatus TaxID=218467 RepID=UPI000C6D02D0|nr:uncharacterized protein LOC111616308 [Centruroides sculpturatus]
MIGKAKEEIINDWENAPRYEIVSLNANSYYKVEVRAHNQIGFSQDATMIFQTAADPSKGAQGFPFSSSGTLRCLSNITPAKLNNPACY